MSIFSNDVMKRQHSLNLPDDQLPSMAIAGMLPNIREKLFGMEFENIGQLAQRLSLMNSQAQLFKKDYKFQNAGHIDDTYQGFLDRSDEYYDEDEIAAAELTWASKPTQVEQQWLKQQRGTYDFDVTKSDKLFAFLVKEGRIKLPEGHPMLRPEGVKEKKYCGYHNTTSHSINDCRVFRVRIQKAILEGHLEFRSKMKIDHEPFPQNTVSIFIDTETVSNSNMKEGVDPEIVSPLTHN